MFVRITLISISLLTTDVHAAENCSADKLVGSCDVLQKLGWNVNGAKELNLPKFEDGSIIYNDLGLSKGKNGEPPKPSTAQSQRSIKVSEEIRAAFVGLVTGDTREAFWTEEQKAMLAKLKSLKVNLAGTKEESCNSSPVSAFDPNASYFVESNRILICPPVVALAPAAQKMLIAHEFGHALSPCAMNSKNPTTFPHLSDCLARSYKSNFETYEKKFAGKSGNGSGNDLGLRPAKSVQCLGIYEEHFAEAIGSKVFGRMLAGSSDKNAIAKVGLVQMQGYACGEKMRGKKDPGAMFRYPSSMDRVQIQMSEPTTQAALGCELAPTDVCTADSAPSSSSPNSPKGSKQ